MTIKYDDLTSVEPPNTVHWSATYGLRDMHNALAMLPPSEINQLPFGVIKMDKKGTILLYSATEGQLAGFDPAKAVGRNVFCDIAP